MWARDIVAAIKSQPPRSTPPPPKKPTGPGTERPKKTARAPAKRPPGFTFAGCWHCKSPDPSRSGGRDGKGAKCLVFAKLLKEAIPGVTECKKMKLPAGYQGAYEKALIAAGGKPRRLNMLEDEDVDGSDSESDFESPFTPGMIRGPTSSKPTHGFSDESACIIRCDPPAERHHVTKRSDCLLKTNNIVFRKAQGFSCGGQCHAVHIIWCRAELPV